jgi:hypothetical protein
MSSKFLGRHLYAVPTLSNLSRNRPSLTKQLAELRREYTGETDSTLMPAIAASMAKLGAEDRANIMGILNGDELTSQFGPDELPRVRQVLFADAKELGQQELESGILAAASRAVNYLHLRPPADLGRPARIFRMVRPKSDELVVHLHPGVLGPLLAEMLPRVVDGDLVGIAGLRAIVHRRHVELYLLDNEQAKVLLSAVAFRQWAAALAFVEKVVPPMRELRWLGNTPRPLAEAEQSVLATRHRAPGPAHLNSALLRRAGVFRDARWWSAWTHGCDTTKVEWPSQPSVEKVAALLLHPLYGLPGGRQQLRHFDQHSLSIVDNDTPRCPLHPAAGHAELVLRPNIGPNDTVLLGPGSRDADDAWRAWDQALSAPNPTPSKPWSDVRTTTPEPTEPDSQDTAGPACDTAHDVRHSGMDGQRRI